MLLKSGYGYAITTVVLWAMYNLIGKVSLTFGINPVIYVCVGMIVASSLLFQAAGPGTLSSSTFKQPRTIIFSLLNILEQTFTLYMFFYISGAEGSLMQRVNIFIGLIIAMVFLNRKPSKQDLLGTLIILVGVFLIMQGLNPESKGIAIFWLCLAALCQTIKTFIAELHPESNKATSFRDQARVTAIITFVTSICFLAFILFGSVAKFYTQDSVLFLSMFPDLKDYIHPATFFAGVIFGLINEAPSVYCYFIAIKKVKTENFLALTALVPIITLAGEYIFSLFGILEYKQFDTIGYTAISMIFAGSIIMSIKPAKKQKNEYKKA
jgi:drug/metabolite transporter (DMT)-like permease